MTNPIRTIRQAADKTLKDLSVATGITVSRLSDFERGKVRLSGEDLFDLANALDVTIADLLGDDTKLIGMDVCHYCEWQCHPMPRWSRGNTIIYVCDDNVKRAIGLPPTFCSLHAKHYRYTYRPDLTPSR